MSLNLSAKRSARSIYSSSVARAVAFRTMPQPRSVPTMVSGAAATGINGVTGLHYMVADSDEDLAAAIVHMAADTRFATAMGQEARRFVVERQGWQSALAPLADIIHPVACAA